jgi:uncharacterized protein YcbX
MLRVSELYIYPIKSLGGISIKQAELTDRGFKYDRRWVLVDTKNRFLSQRKYPNMALLKVSITATDLVVTHSITGHRLSIPFKPQIKEYGTVTVWDDPCAAIFISYSADRWFSKILGIKCRLAYMPDESLRKVDENHAPSGFTNSFADGYPFLIIGQSSLDDLNSKLDNSVPINRFRPNIVYEGGKPFEEDLMNNIRINNVNFYGVKLCARCIMVSIDQDTTTKSKLPLKALAKYRRKDNDVYFGQNLIHKGDGIIFIGDEVKVLSVHTDKRFLITT